MKKKNSLELKTIEYFDAPFPHFYSGEALSQATVNDLLHWFETGAPWILVETDFYEQFEFNLTAVDLPKHLRFLIGKEFVFSTKKIIEDIFKTSLQENVAIYAHKLIDGQRIRIHNDHINGLETHRLLIQVNAGWNDEKGGLLILFNSPDPADISKVIMPISNSAVGFAISEASNHAVSKIYGAPRYTLVYTFQEKPR